MIGISVYLNEINYPYLSTTSKYGVTQIFTSFKMVEENYESLLTNANELIEFCIQNNLELIPDVDEKSAERFGLNSLSEFKTLGINRIRIDGGVDNQEIANLSKMFIIYLNASDIKKRDIKELISYGLVIENCVAMHNFYPLENSGLSLEYFVETNKMIKSFGLQVLAFIPGNLKLRGPVFNGLPTLERDRGSRPIVAYLKMKDLVDQIFIGDNEISEDELRLISNPRIIELEVDFFDENNLIDKEHVIRPDMNSTMIRISDRKLISPEAHGYIYDLTKGVITVENKKAIERYQGEIQISKSVNLSNRAKTVIGYVNTFDLPLLDLIKPEHKIKFRKKND